jgi:hypothetical protein
MHDVPGNFPTARQRCVCVHGTALHWDIGYAKYDIKFTIDDSVNVYH